ncbi:MarR family winged helix-turn-helix transcriptional regulator [Eubacteriaceae bacterium ES3]|nr:MarR family winged helix-turn-helix transcriptional regulator [Eubacteriaceae bacterium ES3]
MICKKNDLYEVYQRLHELEAEFLDTEKSFCQAQELTSNQIKYLKIIDARYRVTFSQLAEETNNSKPTITETISRFISQGCVYRERSAEDRRVFYIYLTPKGKSIARAQEKTKLRLIERIQENLTEDEMKQFIILLNKVLS